MGVEKTKEELLEHYAERSPTKFIQYDLFTDGTDDMTPPDKDGDAIWTSQTQELMFGATIRILFKPDITKEVAIRGLGKIIKSIKKNPEFLVWKPFPGQGLVPEI